MDNWRNGFAGTGVMMWLWMILGLIVFGLIIVWILKQIKK